MADVQFDGDNQFHAPVGGGSGAAATRSKMAAWLVRHGIVQSPRQAQVALAAIAAIAIVIAVIAFSLGGSTVRPPETTFTIRPNETVGSPQGLPPGGRR